MISQARRYGIHSFKTKSDYSTEEWKALIDSSQERLVMVGHALDKWCSEDVRPTFERTLQRLARDGKSVELLTLPLDGPNTTRITDQRGKDYNRRINQTYEVIGALLDALPTASRNSVKVRALNGNIDMPYMLVANEKTLVTCAYPSITQSSDGMLTIAADPNQPFGTSLRNDVRELLSRHSVDVTLPVTAGAGARDESVRVVR